MVKPAAKVPVIAVVIPAYRAERHIGSVLSGIPAFVSHIVVVNDASPDGTGSAVERWPDKRVQLVSHSENRGVGEAVLTGYDTAMALGVDVLVKMDGDAQMDPAYVGPLVAPILAGEADYTKGNRFLHSRELKSMPLVRRVGNAALSFLTKLASGYWQCFDPTNGYTAIHAKVLPLLRRESIDGRYFFETSMLLELSLARAVVQDVSIPARYGEETSSLSEWRVAREFPGRLLRGLLRRVFIHYFVRDFTAFSVFFLAGTALTAFGATWGAYHWVQASLRGVLASTGTVMIAVLPIIVGLQLLLEAVILDIQSVPTRPRQLEWRPAPTTMTGQR